MENLEKEKLELKVEEAEVDAKDFLTSYSRLKRWALIIIIIMIIPAFFIGKYLTSYFYFKNFSAHMIQVHKAALVELPVSVLDVSVLQMSGNSYSAYAYIKNPNKQLSAPEADYTFHFYDQQGSEIAVSGQQASGTTYFLPGEVKYVVVPNVSLSRAPSRVTVEFSAISWKQRISIPNVIINTSLPVYANAKDNSGFTVDGTFQNASNYSLGSITIVGVIKDQSGKVIAVTSHVANTITPEEQRGYHMFWPVPLGSAVGSVQVYPETNVLDPNNVK